MLTYPLYKREREKTMLIKLTVAFLYLILLNISSAATFDSEGSLVTNTTSSIKTEAFASAIGLTKTSIIVNCKNIRYSFFVTNEGNEVLENVELIDPLLGGIVPGPWSGDTNLDGLLDVDETWVYVSTYEITEDDINAGQVVNQATVSASVLGEPDNMVTDLSDHDSVLEDDPTVTNLSGCNPNIALIKTSIVVNCKNIRYSFFVTNEGNEVLENVELIDPLLGGIVPGPWSGDTNLDGLLDFDETWIYVSTYEVTEDDINVGEVVNQATVSASVLGEPDNVVTDLSDNDSVLEDDPTVTDLSGCLPNPNIALIKTSIVVNCKNIRYSFFVTNEGNEVLENVELIDPLLGGIVPGPWSGDTNLDGLLDFDETWIYVSTYEITGDDINEGEVVNQATVSASVLGEPDNVVTDFSDNDSVLEDDPTVTDLSECQQPSIALLKESELIDVDGDGCNDTIRYTFTVDNTGNLDLKEIILEDFLMGGEIPELNSGDILNDDILTVEETWVYIVLYDILQEDIDAGEVINQATVSGETLVSNTLVSDFSDDDSFLEDEPTITIVRPDETCVDGSPSIAIIKEAELVDIDGDGCDDSILYTFTVINQGDVNLEDISLEDDFLGGIILGPNFGDDDEDGILSVGETWMYESLYNINQEDIDQGSIVNQAVVLAKPEGIDNQVFDLSDDNNFNENDPTITLVDGTCNNVSISVGLIKTGILIDTNNDGCNDFIQYTFTVANLGNISFEAILLEDQLLDGTILNLVSNAASEDGILGTDEQWTYNALYNITQIDIDTGIVINQATIRATLLGTAIQILDLSDDNSFEEDEATVINVLGTCDDNTESFEIFNGITPNGDGLNDYFKIVGIENYPNNNLKIFNRWGVLVYETDNYGQENNLFKGTSEGRLTIAQGRELPSGTYFYTLTFFPVGPGKDSYSGYLYINKD